MPVDPGQGLEKSLQGTEWGFCALYQKLPLDPCKLESLSEKEWTAKGLPDPLVPAGLREQASHNFRLLEVGGNYTESLGQTNEEFTYFCCAIIFGAMSLCSS